MDELSLLPFMSVPNSLLVEQHNCTHISSVTHVRLNVSFYIISCASLFFSLVICMITYTHSSMKDVFYFVCSSSVLIKYSLSGTKGFWDQQIKWSCLSKSFSLFSLLQLEYMLRSRSLFQRPM